MNGKPLSNDLQMTMILPQETGGGVAHRAGNGYGSLARSVGVFPFTVRGRKIKRLI